MGRLSDGRRSRATYMDAVKSAGGAEVVGKRIAQWVAREAEKDAARTFGVSLRTVKGWRAGQLPQMRHLMAMATRWGESFLEDVFAPLMSVYPSVDGRLQRLEAEIASIRRQIGDEAALAEAVDRARDIPRIARARGAASANVLSVSHHFDELGNQVEVSWLKDLNSTAVTRFKQAMRGVAGAPPALATWDRQTYGLTSVHVLDVHDTDPNKWHFLARGWTGVDADDCSRIGMIRLPAVKEQAIMSYLNAKAFADTSVASVHRTSPQIGSLVYNRVIVPQAGLDGRTQLLWVGIEKVAENSV